MGNKKKNDSEDFSNYCNDSIKSKKELLIDKCRTKDVSIYIDDESETSSGIYAEFRAVASEAELERRLSANCAVSIAYRSNIISIAALVVAVISLAMSFF